MSEQIPCTAEIWVLEDGSGVKRDCLVLNSTPDGYTIGWLLHTYNKGTENLLVKTVRGERYIDPRKLTYWHTATFQTLVAQLKSNDYIKIKTKASQLLGMGVQSKELEERTALAEANIASMGKKILELTIERDAYKSICEKAVSAAAQPPAPEPDAPKEAVDRKALREAKKQANIERYARKQSYIAVKLKSLHMTQTTLGLMIGISGNTISGWIKGVAPAKWHLLERVFPGIEQEAEAWLKKEGG